MADVSESLSIVFLAPASSPHVVRWTAHLAERGHFVRLASMHAPEPIPGVEIVPLSRRPHLGPTSVPTMFGAVPAARSVVRAGRVDVVVAYYLSSYGLLGALSGASPLVGAAAGGDVLEDSFDTVIQRLRIRLTLRFVLRRCRGILAWAPHVADRIGAFGYPASRILVQPRGIDLQMFPMRSLEPRDPASPLRVVSLRWLKPLYRVDTLVEALGILAARNVRFEVRIVGDGPERARLQARAQELGIRDRVAFLGTLDRGGVVESLRWADVYVSTSSTDGASSSLFEALATGAFPVVTDIPANRAVLGELGARSYFTVGDAGGLADRLETAARDEADRLEAIRLGRELAERNLDLDRNQERVLAFLRAIAGSPEKRGLPSFSG